MSSIFPMVFFSVRDCVCLIKSKCVRKILKCVDFITLISFSFCWKQNWFLCAIYFFVLTFRLSVFHILHPCWQFGFLNQIYRFPVYENFFSNLSFSFLIIFFFCFINFWEFKEFMSFMLIRHHTKRANWNSTVFAQEFADLISIYITFRLN